MPDAEDPEITASMAAKILI